MLWQGHPGDAYGDTPVTVDPVALGRIRPLGRLADWLRDLGAMAQLARGCAGAMTRSTPGRRRELIRQTAAILRAALPASMLSIAAWGFAGPGLQAGNFLVTFGSIDRAGGFMVVAIVREFGTYVTATVVAGVVGTMFTAELSTRRVRGELDALSVLGVDPVKELVAPRVLALVLTMMGLDLLALVCGVLGGYLATTLVLGGTSGGVFPPFFSHPPPPPPRARPRQGPGFRGVIGGVRADPRLSPPR